MKSSAIARTRWGAVALLYFAGCTLALHVGKLPGSLPLLTEQFHLSLSQAGSMVSVHAVLIVCSALLLGIIVARTSYAFFAIVGLALCLLGSLFGSLTGNATLLMMSRAVEGLGWIFGVVAFPSLFSTLATVNDRSIVLGIWGSFMPVGIGLIMLLTPSLIIAGGWQLVWHVSTALTATGLLVLVYLSWHHRDLFGGGTGSNGYELSVLKKPASCAVLICFGVYSFLFVGTTSLLPLLLVEDSGLAYGLAVYWSTVVVLCNAVGNVASGWLLKQGVTRVRLIVVSLVLTGGLAFVVFAVSEPVVRVIAACLLTTISGLIPGTLFSSAPVIAGGASAVGVVVGFMLTGTGIGQLSGPWAVSQFVEWHGEWFAGGVVCVAVAALGAWSARQLSTLSD